MTDKPHEKAAYTAPKLTQHGTIRSMTHTNPPNGNPNDALGPGAYQS